MAVIQTIKQAVEKIEDGMIQTRKGIQKYSKNALFHYPLHMR